MDVRRARIGSGGFSFFKVRRDFAKLRGVHSSSGFDQFETIVNGRAGAIAFARDRAHAHAVNAIHPKHCEGRRRFAGLFRFELADQSERARREVFIEGGWLRAESGKKLARRSRGAQPKRAVLGKRETGIQREETGVGALEQFNANGVEVFGRRRQQNESLAQAGDEFEQDAAKPAAVVLKGQNHRHSINRP